MSISCESLLFLSDFLLFALSSMLAVKNILSRARQITSTDFDLFNYIIAMDDSNFRNIQDLKNRTASTSFASIKKIQDFRSVFNEQEVPDTYFGGDEGFDYVIDILEDSVNGFLESIS